MSKEELVWIDTNGDLLVLTSAQHSLLAPLLWHMQYKCLGRL